MVNKIHARRNEHLFEKCYNCPRSPLCFNIILLKDRTFRLIFLVGKHVSVKNRATLNKLCVISCKIAGCCTPKCSLKEMTAITREPCKICSIPKKIVYYISYMTNAENYNDTDPASIEIVHTIFRQAA